MFELIKILEKLDSQEIEKNIVILLVTFISWTKLC